MQTVKENNQLISIYQLACALIVISIYIYRLTRHYCKSCPVCCYNLSAVYIRKVSVSLDEAKYLVIKSNALSVNVEKKKV